MLTRPVCGSRLARRGARFLDVGQTPRIAASTACSPLAVGEQVGVPLIKRMPPLAGFFASVECGWPVTAEHIGCCVDYFHVVWVDALLDAAQVINLEPIRDCSYEQLVGEAMCAHEFVTPTEPTVRFSRRADPQPTRCGLLNQRPETPYVGEGNSGVIHTEQYTMNVAT